MTAHPGETPAGVASLYPFLYAGGADRSAVFAQVRASTEAKAREIAELRTRLGESYATLLPECAARLADRFAAGARLFAFGNGGSSTDAQALTELFVHPPAGARPLPGVTLSADVATLTALSNDVSFDVVFARPLAAFARAGDIAVGMSTSGGSANVLRGFEEAARRGLLTVGFAGYDGGKMAESATIDYLFVVPSASVHRIQEAQTTTYHVLWELVQVALAARGR